MRKIVITATLVLAGLIAAHVGSPYWTLQRMRTAAVEGEAARLASYVDFPAVRESLKSQFLVAMSKRMETRPAESAFASVGQALGIHMVNGMVDALVTPESVANMIRSGKTPRTFESKSDRATTTRTERREPQIRRGYQGLNTFQASLVDPDTGEDMLTAVLSRDGLFAWKLTAITLPGLVKR